MDRVQCMCCDKWLDAEFLDSDDLLTVVPVYDGLIFRATGNFGSTIFDPMPIGEEEYLLVVICDDCVKSKAKRVTHIFNIERTYSSDCGRFKPNERH